MDDAVLEGGGGLCMSDMRLIKAPRQAKETSKREEGMKSKYRAFPRRWFTETLASHTMTFNNKTSNYKMATIEVKWHSYDANPPSVKARDEIARSLFWMMDEFEMPRKAGKVKHG